MEVFLPLTARMMFLGGLIWAAVHDARTREIPDGVHGVIALAALLELCSGAGAAWYERVIGAVCVSLPMLLLCLAVEGAFGGGDIKLTAAAGLFLGWKLTLVGTFLSILAGGAWGAGLLLGGKAGRKDQFAFGPFLCAGLAAALFWGQRLLDWYLGAVWPR